MLASFSELFIIYSDRFISNSIKIIVSTFRITENPLLYRRHSFYYNLWLFLRRLLRWLLYLSKNDWGIMRNAATFFLLTDPLSNSSHKPLIIVKTYFNLIIYAQYYFTSDQFISNYRYLRQNIRLENINLGIRIRYRFLEKIKKWLLFYSNWIRLLIEKAFLFILLVLKLLFLNITSLTGTQ